MQSQPIDFHPPATQADPILLPVTSTLFADRAERFASLARQHSLGDWLNFLADLSRAQHEVLQCLPSLQLPDARTLEQARTHAMPPLNASSLPRPAAWRLALQQLVQRLQETAPESGQAALTALLAASESELESLADMLLKGEPDMARAAELPFVAAALQIVFTQLASQLEASHLHKLDAPGVCPCCGSLPVASVVRLGSAINNLRYLHCSLCNTEWNLVRANCASCGETDKVSYRVLESADGSTHELVRAEVCGDCHSYLKLVLRDKDASADPVADDLATLALDILVDEAGYLRSGPNPLFIPGNADE